jgi:hypothetical protein
MKLQELLENYDDEDIDWSEKAQLDSVEANGDNLEWIIRDHGMPSEKVLQAAVKESPGAISYILDADEIPSEAVQLITAKGYGETIIELHHRHIPLSKQVLNAGLTEYNFIHVDDTNNPHMMSYDDFVKLYFKNNTVLMNKWLRYAKNVREMG